LRLPSIRQDSLDRFYDLVHVVEGAMRPVGILVQHAEVQTCPIPVDSKGRVGIIKFRKEHQAEIAVITFLTLHLPPTGEASEGECQSPRLRLCQTM